MSMAKRSSVRTFTSVALVIAAGALAWLAVGGLGDNLVYYWTPTELKAAPRSSATVRLGGQVKAGTLVRSGASDVDFVVSDGSSDVKVHSSAVPPQMFREGIGVIVEGVLDAGGVFQSERIMVKHGNEYRAPAPGEKPPANMGAGT
jgi:cytochrome c-type biogenesis protein CcmE